MVMELLEGETLLALLERERKLSVGVACEFTLQILEALEAAHALGVVHRDLKPENVFVTHGTRKTTVKLIDFGIAKVRREGGAELTIAGVTMGTAEYMAPEQAFSADKVDARSDLYAVGVMLYEMLSGTRPVTGDDPRVIAVKVERGEIKPLVHARRACRLRSRGSCTARWRRAPRCASSRRPRCASRSRSSSVTTRAGRFRSRSRPRGEPPRRRRRRKKRRARRRRERYAEHRSPSITSNTRRPS